MIDALYDKFKEWSKGGSVYIYSDSHFSDLDCYKLRFPDEYEEAEEYFQAHQNYEKFKGPTFVEKLDEMQINNINKLCNKCDTLVILGDIGNIECIKKLKAGRKILIMGNHDCGASNYKNLFDEVYEGPLFIGKRILLSHEPVEFDYALNIHGHVHSDKKRKKELYCFNACAEYINYTPVNLKDILNSGIMKNIKDIHRDTIDEAVKRKLKKKEEK